MSDINPNTITICGIDGELNQQLQQEITELLELKGFRATVRIEAAERPHYLYDSIGHVNTAVNGRYRPAGEDVSTIALNGLFTVNELDGISYKLRGGK